MEFLAFAAFVVILILMAFKLNQYLERKYNFTALSGKAIGLLAVSAIGWFLTAAYYDPATLDNAFIKVFSLLFVIGFDALIPLYVLITNIRKTSLFWGLLAFLFQMLVTATAVILIFLMFARWSDKK